MTLTQDNINSFIQYLVDNHIVTLKNNKFRVISIWKNSSRVSNEAKDKVNEFISGYRTEKEAWFCLGHHIFEIPKCPICGNLAKFAGKKYNLCCENHSPNSLQWKKDKVTDAFKHKTREEIDEIRKKVKNTLKERYGDEHYGLYGSEVWKRNLMNKYGNEYYSNQEQARKTCLERYGVDHNFKLVNSSEKSKKVWKEKHNEIVNKQRNTLIEHYGSLEEARAHINKISWEKREQRKLQFEKDNLCTSKSTLMEKYGQGWLSLRLPQVYDNGIAFIYDKYIDDIKNYKPSEYELQVVSDPEKEIAEYVKSIIGDDNVITSDRRTIKMSNKCAELDIYVPSHKLAIEYDGIYWHSTQRKTNDYHIKKTKACQEKGIRLIHVFQDEWENYPNKVKSLIRTSLGMFEYRVGARKCEIREVSSKDYRDFCSKFHLQGPVNSCYRIGLYCKDQLIQCIGIGKSRFKKNEMELHRMCTREGWQVIGGFSKLMKKACTDLRCDIISYIARDKFNGNGYVQCGFEKITETKPSYFYVDKFMRRHSRIEFQKHKIKENKELVYDDNKTEQENMLINKFNCVYDCGTIKMIYKYQE